MSKDNLTMVDLERHWMSDEFKDRQKWDCMWCARTCSRWECSQHKVNGLLYFTFNRKKDVPKDLLKILRVCPGWAP